MAKAKRQIKRVSRRRPAGLAAAPLTSGAPELGAPQLGQIHHIRRRVHHLTAASLPGAAPDFVFLEDHVAQSAAVPPSRVPRGPQTDRLKNALKQRYTGYPCIPTEDEEPKLSIDRWLRAHLKECPPRKTVYRLIAALRNAPRAGP